MVRACLESPFPVNLWCGDALLLVYHVPSPAAPCRERRGRVRRPDRPRQGVGRGAARLGAVCRHWEAADFDALVDRIARTKLRWADLGYPD
ncbi:hypothetical protein tb265_24990 [Gemmatimonadetes bacterium T265]|nr:hypothetical protein tb265_24990 [Gemmatimonadetes bacterium T265]